MVRDGEEQLWFGCSPEGKVRSCCDLRVRETHGTEADLIPVSCEDPTPRVLPGGPPVLLLLFAPSALPLCCVERKKNG